MDKLLLNRGLCVNLCSKFCILNVAKDGIASTIATVLKTLGILLLTSEEPPQARDTVGIPTRCEQLTGLAEASLFFGGTQ